MKTTDVSDYGDQSCSCTSCVYRSESDRQSLGRIISRGSRIDRLYYGKYIPLRERKLLEKLVRTRGVYDDLKAQLVSSNTTSLDTKSGLRLLGRKLSGKKINSPQHSGAVLELVDLIDKGEKVHLGSKHESDCCRCCSCSSKINLNYKSIESRKPKLAHPGTHRYFHARERFGENRRRGVRFKAKHIKSDPCTCTFKFSGMLKNVSKLKPKRTRTSHPISLVDLKPNNDEEINQRSRKIHNLVRSSIENLERSRLRVKNIMMEGARKLSETKMKVIEKKDLQIKKSIDTLKRVQNNIKSKRNILKQSHEDLKNDNIATCDCPEKKLISQIKKDSISKFKDDLKRKQILRDWECDSECLEDICIPEECYYKLTQRKSRRLKFNDDNLSTNDQSKGPSNNPIEDKQKPILRAQSTHKTARPVLNITSNKEGKKSKKVQKDIVKVEKKKFQIFCKCKKKSNHKTRSVKSGALKSATAVNNVKNKKTKLTKKVSPPREKGIHIYQKTKAEDVHGQSRQQVVRIGSSFTFNIEFYKNKAQPPENIPRINLQRQPSYSTQSIIKDNNKKYKKNLELKKIRRRQRGSQITFKHNTKNTKIGDDNLKRCLCPLVLKSKNNKLHTDKKMYEDWAEKYSSAVNSESKPCTPLDCAISNKCNLIECKQRNLKYLNNVETNTTNVQPKKIKKKKTKQRKIKEKQLLLPYECEPGVCVPDSCDPYECIKLINVRKAKTNQRSVQCDCSAEPSYTRRHKSTSSLSLFQQKQSSSKPKLISHKSGMRKNKLHRIKTFREKKLNNKDQVKNDRQVVRIGSTFSFNIEFHKTKSYGDSLKQVNFKTVSNDTHAPIQKKTARQIFTKYAPSKKYLPKNIGFGTTLRRCFCTLKLQEKKTIKTKRKKVFTSDADFVNNVETSNKSTKTKYERPLRATECEPFVCIPGLCDPYECLDRINKRYKHLTETGSITESPETKSASSTTYSKKSFKTINVQSTPRLKNRKIASKIKKYAFGGKPKQIVRVGSSFSFNIDFVKGGTPMKDTKPHFHIEQKPQYHYTKEKRNKRKVNKLNVANVNTQAKVDQKSTKVAMAGHLVKRCFCTLNLQKRKYQPSIFPREYTINTALTELNTILNCKNKKLNFISDNRPNKNRFSNLNYLQAINFQEKTPVEEQSSQLYNLNPLCIDRWISSSSFIEDRLMYLKQTEIRNLNHYTRHCFCTMNLQVVNNKTINRYPKSATSSTGKSTKGGSRNKKYGKSSVRMGSNFSFNIEFSKSATSSSQKNLNNMFLSKYSSDTKLSKAEESKLKRFRNEGTKRNNIYKNQQSQSAIVKLAHRDSATAPIRKRCFCTLKLQKKGRWQAKNNKKQLTKIPDKINPNLNRVMTVSTAQNTTFKPLNMAHSLKPYECEPNICVPGYCDPYQCLEIMKKRRLIKHTKDYGVVTLKNNKSASSITIGNLSKGTQKKYHLKEKAKQSEVKLPGRKYESGDIKPSKQIVRVGSSFSFNIEFFKDQQSPTQNLSHDIIQRKQLKKPQETSRIKNQNSVYLKNKMTESKNFPRIASTMTTSLTKRCFCTRQLKDFNNKNIEINLKNEPTFLQKCLCALKLRKPFTTGKQEGIHIKKVPHFDKKINTQNIIVADEQRLPYECDPGMCIPGECNPYDCYNVLKKKYGTKKSTGSTTAEIRNLRSTSSNTAGLVRNNAKTQSMHRKKLRDIKERSFSQSSFRNSNKQAVRIGSNFSFNIEFYKNKSPEYVFSRTLQQTPSKSVENKFHKMNKKKLKTDLVKTRSQKSQFERIHKTDRFTEDKHFLKRCFCTLQLQNQHSKLQTQQGKEKEKHQDIKVRTKSVMTKKEDQDLNIMKLYECDPDICVPYQCDPYRCEKIMKLRRKQQDYKEAGSVTKSTKQFAVGSETAHVKKKKYKTQTNMKNNYERSAYYNNKYKESRPTQRVKIGSSFEFNIEFSKNKNELGLEINKQPKPLNLKSKQLMHDTTKKSKAQITKHKQVKFGKTNTKSTEFKSTAENKSPLLKRCFCTLFKKKPEQIENRTLKSITSTVGTETRKAFDQTALLPYECEPFTCIPGECNPIECLERIKKRQKHFGATTNLLQKKYTASTMTTSKGKPKTKKNQFRSHDAKDIQIKTERSAKSNKQAVRIGSNFSFNIEFYKKDLIPDITSNNLKNRQNVLLPKSGIKKQSFKELLPNIRRQSKRLKFKHSKPNKLSVRTKSELLKSKKDSCDLSNCPELKAHGVQTKGEKILYNKSNENKNTFLKKCFCVFKIRKIDKQKHKSDVNKNQILQRHLKRNILTQEKLLPYECEPNVCVPGNCDPYECEKLIKKRIRQKAVESNMSKVSATDEVKSKSVRLQVPKTKSQEHKMTMYVNNKQNRKLSNFSQKDNNKNPAIKFAKKSLRERNQVVDVPKNTNLNKQAVRIGSNISFNIEFYKQAALQGISIPLRSNKPTLYRAIKKTSIKDINNVHDKHISTKAPFISNRASQAKAFKTEDKTLEVRNPLSRCFCTLKLQKNLHSRYRQKNINSLLTPPLYPQTFEVRRVALQHKTKEEFTKKFPTSKSVATKINKKYVNQNKKLQVHNICPCKNEIMNSSEMETILPYTPTKFKKTSSKTLIPLQDNFLIKNKIKGQKEISYGKKLNKKKSKRNLDYSKKIFEENKNKENSMSFKRFLCNFSALFARKEKGNNKINTNKNTKSHTQVNNEVYVNSPKQTCNVCFERLRTSKSDRRPVQRLVQDTNMKKTKSLKLYDKCNSKCIIYSSNKDGPNNKSPTVTLRVDQRENRENNFIKENNKPKKTSKFMKQSPDAGFDGVLKRKEKNEAGLCIHCKKKYQKKVKEGKGSTPPLKVHFVENVLTGGSNFKKTLKSPKDPLKFDKDRKDSHKYCEYCDDCGRHVHKVELQKAAGDRSNADDKKNLKNANNRIKELFKFNKDTDNVCSGEYKEKPLFAMQLSSDDYNILNKEEVLDKVTKLSKKSNKGDKSTKAHKKSCRCCYCVLKKNKAGAHIHVKAKGSKIARTFGSLLGGSKAKAPTSRVPCTCGSLICLKNNQKMKTPSPRKKINKKQWKPCFCGSPICDRESAAMRALSVGPDKIKCICRQERDKINKKIKAKNDHLESKHRAILQKKYNKEDITRKKIRQKLDKAMEKRINKKSSDLVLLAESVIDIGKLGITACTDVLRSVARCASDPKQAYYTLKAMKKNPELICRHLKSAYDDSGVAATARRVRLRCLAMRGVKKVKTTLEKYAITNYLLHIADKDPKSRLPKKVKPERVRDRLDFGCSLYMASLRKRPHLSVYDRCPWFYPHFLSLVNVWKQFIDITLFLLAVVVWSPCILCMEVCRAMMCCFFCTG